MPDNQATVDVMHNCLKVLMNNASYMNLILGAPAIISETTNGRSPAVAKLC